MSSSSTREKALQVFCNSIGHNHPPTLSTLQSQPLDHNLFNSDHVVGPGYCIDKLFHLHVWEDVLAYGQPWSPSFRIIGSILEIAPLTKRAIETGSSVIP